MQKRRDFVFNELHRLVCEFDDAVLTSGIESAWDVDHELGAMLIRLNAEKHRVLKLQKPLQTEAA